MQINLNTQDIKCKNIANQNAKLSFKGFVGESFKKHINNLAKEDVDKFLNTSLSMRTETEVENEILKPIKTAYRKLTEIMKDKFPEDIGVISRGETPLFVIKHKDNTLETVYWRQWYLSDKSSTRIYKTKDFIRFVQEISENGAYKPSRIIKDAEYSRNEKANELLKEKFNNLNITD